MADDYASGDKTIVQPMRVPSRRVPEPPKPRRLEPPPPQEARKQQPIKKETPKAEIIPITRARTTPPKSFDACVSMPALAPMQLPPDNAATTPVAKVEPELQGAPTIVTRAPSVMPAVREKARWATFAAIGLGQPKEKERPPLQAKAAKYLVSSYRALGFGILTIIVVVLVGYIVSSAFYFVDDSWVEPMVVSTSDERVVAMQAQVAQQQNARDQIAADLNAADREIAVQQAFQSEFAAAIRQDLQGRKDELDRVRDLAGQYASARGKIQRQNSAYASSSNAKMAKEYAAGLIDRDDMLAGKYQVAQIATSNLSLAEREADFKTRAEDLEAQAASLEQILDESGGDQALSYDVLQIKQQYEQSRLDSQKAIENREALAASLKRQDEILAGLRASPYLRAVADGASVAFVPYGNLKNVKAGTALYACDLDFFWCHKVGKVIEVLPGEVTYKHPHRDKQLRGQMVELQLTDQSAAREDVLFLGDKPLFL